LEATHLIRVKRTLSPLKGGEERGLILNGVEEQPPLASGPPVLGGLGNKIRCHEERCAVCKARESTGDLHGKKTFC